MANQSAASPELDFRLLFESAPGLYLVLRPDLHIVAVSEAYLGATMTTRENLLGRYLFDAFPDNPDDPAATGVGNLRASLGRVIEGRLADSMALQKYDVRRPETEGGGFEARYWSPMNVPVLDARGEVVYIIHRVEDVTEFVALKEAGAKKEERAAAEILMRAREVAEANRHLRLANDGLKRLYAEIAELMAQADPIQKDQADPEHKEEVAALQDGAFPEESSAPEEMVGRVARLIRKYLHMGEELRQAQKMEAVGRLAGGVAHDFNNLLTAITGYAHILGNRLAMLGPQPELIEIERAADRAATLTSRLLAFSRKQVLRPRVIDLNSVVTGIEDLVRRLIGEDISFVTALGSGCGRVQADPTQLEQVVMNLAVNARDAMPEGGRLVIETRHIELAAGAVALLPAGRYVMMSVSDTGHGMDAETVKRIFEPFFTTKEEGRGTGLGLATSHGIVEQSGGAMTVKSAPGHGTTFRIYLPQTEAQDEVEVEQAAPRVTETKVQAAKILVAEDQEPLQRLIQMVLKNAGYSVVEASSGAEALAACAKHGDAIDLILTDVIMPGMSGPEAVTRIRETSPNAAVLFMSGYDRALLDRTAFRGGANFLAKPFTPQVLLDKVREALDSRHENLKRMRAG